MSAPQRGFGHALTSHAHDGSSRCVLLQAAVATAAAGRAFLLHNDVTSFTPHSIEAAPDGAIEDEPIAHSRTKREDAQIVDAILQPCTKLPLGECGNISIAFQRNRPSEFCLDRCTKVEAIPTGKIWRVAQYPFWKFERSQIGR